jgi:hypothetical protein
MQACLEIEKDSNCKIQLCNQFRERILTLNSNKGQNDGFTLHGYNCILNPIFDNDYFMQNYLLIYFYKSELPNCTRMGRLHRSILLPVKLI